MSDGGESFIVGLGALWMLVAGGGEAWLRRRKHPRRYVYAWLMWTPMAILFIAGATASTDMNTVAVVVIALLVGPLLYPLVSLMAELHVRMHQPARQEIWDDLQRARYRPTDFGSNNAAPAPEQHPSTEPPPPSTPPRAPHP